MVTGIIHCPPVLPTVDRRHESYHVTILEWRLEALEMADIGFVFRHDGFVGQATHTGAIRIDQSPRKHRIRGLEFAEQLANVVYVVPGDGFFADVFAKRTEEHTLELHRCMYDPSLL